MSIDTSDFDLTIPLVRHNPGGGHDERDITLRIPAVNQDEAACLADQIGWEIVSRLPKVGPNNRHGWKIANYGPAAEPAKEF